MSRDWNLIARGFALASLGSGASMLLIVGLSASYVGRYGLAVWLLFAALATALLFRRWVMPFLDTLERRVESNQPIAGDGPKASRQQDADPS